MAAALLMAGPSAQAADRTWAVNPSPAPADLDWSTNGNWVDDTPPSPGDVAVFQLAVTGRRTPNLDSDRTVQGLNFTVGANEFTLGSTGNHTLSVGTSGIAVGSAGQVINHGITSTGTAAGTFITLSNPNTSTLTINGALNVSSFAGTNPTMSLQSGTRLTLAGAITTGTGQFTQGGTSDGIVRITSSNNTIAADRYSLSAGILEIGGGGTGQFGGKRVITGSLSGQSKSVLLVDANTNFDSEVRLFQAGGSTATQTIGGNITSGTATFSGNIGLRDANQDTGIQAIRFTSAASGTINFTGEVKDDSGSTPGAVEKVGAGTVVFSPAAGNTYSAGTTVSAGTLLVNTSTAIGSGTGLGAVLVKTDAFFGTSMAGRIGGNLTLEDSANFAFTLGAPDSILLTAAGTTTLFDGFDLDNIAITTGAGFDVGTYTLLTGGTLESFTFGSNLTGTYDGLQGTLSRSGESLVLTVIPEPSSAAALLGSLCLLMLRRNRR